MNVRPLLCAASSLWIATTAAANPEFDRWAESFTQDWIRADPARSTGTQYLPLAEQEVLDRQLPAALSDGTPLLEGERAARAALARRGLEELRRFPDASLTPVQRASADYLSWRLQDVLRTLEFAHQRYVFDQFRGLHVFLVNLLTQEHPIRNARDVESYLARLERVAPVLDVGIEAARANAERGVVLPRFIIKSTLESIDRFLSAAPNKNVFVTSLDERIAKLKDYPAADRTAAGARAEELVTTAVRPAFERVKALLNQQREQATDEAGVWRLPRGREMYAAALATFTTTTLDAEAIHEIGLRQVERIEREMDRVLIDLGHRDGSIQERFYNVQALLLPRGQPDPRPKMLEEITRVVRDAEKRAEALFDKRPRAPVEVRREPPFTELTAAARYSRPAPDGSQPGIYWIPLGRLTPDVIWIGAGTRSVAYHEAVPGHHFQIALQQESTDLPRFRKLNAYGFISAYGEGWALYAERIADEAGWYKGDDVGRLGYLSMQLLRAKRLVVDTGLHAKKWTREQAIDYGIQESEVERYIVWPGQACSYMIGQLRILDLREKAQNALAEKFSLKEFHNVVLSTGTVPLDVLAKVIDRWIEEQK